MHWCTHLSFIPPGFNFQAFEHLNLGPIRSINLCFLYENQETKKCVRSDSVQVHVFLVLHLKQKVHKI